MGFSLLRHDVGFWLLQHKDAIHSVGEIVAAVAAIIATAGVMITSTGLIVGALFGLIQYVKGNQLRAADTLLKVEEEFRVVLPVLAEIEDLSTYRRVIAPVLEAEKVKTLDDKSLKKLVDIDRALRFFYFCSVLNESLGVDRVFGVTGGALQRAYYHYLRFLLPNNRDERPELLRYTDNEYKRLTAWIRTHRSELERASAADLEATA